MKARNGNQLVQVSPEELSVRQPCYKMPVNANKVIAKSNQYKIHTILLLLLQPALGYCVGWPYV